MRKNPSHLRLSLAGRGGGPFSNSYDDAVRTADNAEKYFDTEYIKSAWSGDDGGEPDCPSIAPFCTS